ncbi:glycosyltransferase [bacterium]|nr:glycosyltransferase [bacterium]
MSNWQREQYCQKFGIDPAKTFVLRNAIAPAFQNLFSQGEAIYPQKERPPVLAYTSTPFRGLDLLLQLFPRIRDRIPGTRLKVFSSMKVYQVSEAQDRERHGHLYQQCLDTEGVEYVGSIPQPQLAAELRHVSALAYPNTFPETSCIVAMEAMAGGCWVVSSELGALPETTAGFGRLVPLTEDRDAYADRFVAETVDVLTLDSSESEVHLRSQVAHMNQTCTWRIRATQCSEWLTALIEQKGGMAFVPYSPAYRGYHMAESGKGLGKQQIYLKRRSTAEPDVSQYYWYLGLAQLLDGREEDAQATWLSVMVEADPDCSETLTDALIDVLLHEAVRRQELSDERLAWVLRGYIRELNPGNLINDLHIINLSISLELFDGLDELLVGVSESLKSQEPTEDERNLLLTAFEKLVAFDLLGEALGNALVEQASQSQEVAGALIRHIETIFEGGVYPNGVLTRFAAFGLRLRPGHLPFLARAIGLYQKIGDHKESIHLVNRFINSATNPLDRIAGLYLSIKALLESGENFYRAKQSHEELIILLEELMTSEEQIHESHLTSLIATMSFFSYLEDNPGKMHHFRRRFASFWQAQVATHAQRSGYHVVVLPPSNRLNPEKVLKIGYLSACFGRHSVGFLSRWLFKYADRDRYHLYAYSLADKVDEIQQFFADSSTFRDVSKTKNIQEIAKLITEDEIDILVDLDSLTSTRACTVMTLKPAPIQVTWLGFDAIGLPTVDYFIADSYVLPDSAQDYYSEKIWRLPDTYVAVDGFEVDTPDVRRFDLGIPDDAVVYFSSQTGQKRHPENGKLQLEILRAVPNSYFLVKGPNVHQETMEAFFGNLADTVGVDKERIRYLPYVASEKVHRANIAIADVVLDTYPYNGATTTLETRTGWAFPL